MTIDESKPALALRDGAFELRDQSGRIIDVNLSDAPSGARLGQRLVSVTFGDEQVTESPGSTGGSYGIMSA